MNWTAELIDLYDKNQKDAGLMKEGEPVLLPLYHTTVAAQVEVTIDIEGNFRDAGIVPEEEKTTIIPVTEKSASRTAGIEPHPLCDNLKYLAGDYLSYMKDKSCEEKHQRYLQLLSDWANSEYAHEKVKAVYRYVQKAELMSDLYKKGIFVLEEDGSVSSKAKIQVVAQTDAFVRFKVQHDIMPDENILEDGSGKYFAECWKDRTLQECYIQYCQANSTNQGMSYLTGDWTQITYYHPKKIRNEGDGSKLFSANDAENYTYKGRFATKEEAFAIGYDDSQKIHNALKWIIRKQGKTMSDLCLVTWDSDLMKSLDWMEDSDRIGEQIESAAEEEGWDDWEDDWFDVPEYTGTGERDAARFRRALDGYEKNINLSAHTIIMAFDAATTGRLAMVECKNYESSRYVWSIRSWYENCEWRHQKVSKQKGRYAFYGMVGIRDIAELLYGTENSEGFLTCKGERYKEVTKRLMPCILDGKEVPIDMVRTAERRASSPASFSSRFQWERVLTLACSLIRQQYRRRYEEDWTMALDVKCKRRDYLYGRLLALADRVEYRTFEKDEKRETNAKRFMNSFSQHPYRTWKMLEEKLTPYWMKLKAWERLYYQNTMNEIFELFEVDDFVNDTSLNGLYLLGFHNQAYAFQMKKDRAEEEEK